MIALAGLDLTDRLVVCVGGGSVAERRIGRLRAAGARVRVVAPEVTGGLAGLAATGELEWRARPFEASDLDGRLVLPHRDGFGIRRRPRGRRRRGAPRVVRQRPGHGGKGTARLAAETTSGDVMVGVVSTAGADPRRSVAVRDAIAQRLAEGALPLRRRRRTPVGGVALVGGGPGPIDLLTVPRPRAAREADVVVHDRLGPTGVLAELGDDVELIDVGKRPSTTPSPSTRSTRSSSTAPRRACGSCGSRAGTRSSTAAACEEVTPAVRPASPSRSFRASRAPSRCRPPPASPSPIEVCRYSARCERTGRTQRGDPRRPARRHRHGGRVDGGQCAAALRRRCPVRGCAGPSSRSPSSRTGTRPRSARSARPSAPAIEDAETHRLANPAARVRRGGRARSAAARRRARRRGAGVARTTGFAEVGAEGPGDRTRADDQHGAPGMHRAAPRRSSVGELSAALERHGARVRVAPALTIISHVDDDELISQTPGSWRTPRCGRRDHGRRLPAAGWRPLTRRACTTSSPRCSTARGSWRAARRRAVRSSRPASRPTGSPRVRRPRAAGIPRGRGDRRSARRRAAPPRAPRRRPRRGVRSGGARVTSLTIYRWVRRPTPRSSRPRPRQVARERWTLCCSRRTPRPASGSSPPNAPTPSRASPPRPRRPRARRRGRPDHRGTPSRRGHRPARPGSGPPRCARPRGRDALTAGPTPP